MSRYLKKTCLTLPGLVLVARRLALRDDRLLKLRFIRFDDPTRDRLLQRVTDLLRSPRLVDREKQAGDAIRSEFRNRLLMAAIVDLDLEVELDTSTFLRGGVTLHVEAVVDVAVYFGAVIAKSSGQAAVGDGVNEVLDVVGRGTASHLI
jgi:hypothetical protein